MKENYVENIFYGFLVHEDLKEAFTYLKETKQEQKIERFLADLRQPIHPKTGFSWLDETLTAYYRYLQQSFLQILQLVPSFENQEEILWQRLCEILDSSAITMAELEENIQEKIEALGWRARFGKSGRYYSPYIWKKEHVKEYEVTMPHSTETIRVHFLSDFVTKGWLSVISNEQFSVGTWIENEDIYCLEEVYQDELTRPKFQISLLKHETQHLIDRYLYIDEVHQEFRSKLVELCYYPDVSFLNFLLKGARFFNQKDQKAYAFTFVLEALTAYLEEIGIENPLAYLQLCVDSPLEWIRNRGAIQQAAIAVLDRDTQSILQQL